MPKKPQPTESLDVQEALNSLKTQAAAIVEFIAAAQSAGTVTLAPRSAEWFWQGLFVLAHDAQATLEAIEAALPEGVLSRPLPAPVEGGE